MQSSNNKFKVLGNFNDVLSAFCRVYMQVQLKPFYDQIPADKAVSRQQ